MGAIIEGRDPHKNFGHVHALDGLDLTVEEGEIHGFLGPGGAGKSTSLRILPGVLRATSGRLTLIGSDPWADAVALHHRIAYVPGDVALWPSLTGGETIDPLGRMRGGIDTRRLAERFDLDPRKKTRSYSSVTHRDHRRNGQRPNRYQRHPRNRESDRRRLELCTPAAAR